ncbi:MAG: hypothetical protein ABJH68_03460 [Ilumatobacter sp.]|uniref:hypothetical protein n=1 Tax=Ilumatobacter sp. TaxID=1967498 RepID=UPI0032982C22
MSARAIELATKNEPRRTRSRTSALLPPGPSTLRRLVADARVELVPMKSLERAARELRPGSHVSMTCSPARSIEATLDESEHLITAGHSVTPHISARMVRTPEHLAAIRARLVALGIREIFVVGGDAGEPGCYFDAIEFIEALLEVDDARGPEHRQIGHIGHPAYPDTHPFITTEQLHEALHRKQELILATGRTSHVSTQMCFSADQIRNWLRMERASGFTVPVHLGVPGVIDTAKLMTMGVRLGVGTSLRYLTKNRRALGSLISQRSFEPDRLLAPLADDLDELGIDGIHLYTLNQVDATERWRQRTLARNQTVSDTE